MNKGIVLLNRKVIFKITGKTKNKLDDILFRLLEFPILLAIALLAIWIAFRRLDLSATVDKIFDKAYQFLIVINITWFVAKMVNALVKENIASCYQGRVR